MACAVAIVSGCQQPNPSQVGSGAPGSTTVPAGQAQTPSGTVGTPTGSTPGTGVTPQQPGTPVMGASLQANGVETSDMEKVGVEGNVSLFDAPIANATVKIYRAGESGSLATVTTDAQGNFSTQVGLGLPVGAPLRVVAITGAGEALVGLGEANPVISVGGGNYRIAAAKKSAKINESTTLAVAMNPSIELLLAANFTSNGPLSPEASTGLMNALETLVTAAEAALDVLMAGSDELDPAESAAALDYVLSMFMPDQTGPTGRINSLPTSIVETLTEGSQIAMGSAPDPNQTSPLELAFAAAVQQIGTEIQTLLTTAATLNVTVETISFGSQTQGPIVVSPGKPTVTIKVNINTQDGEFKQPSTPPTIVLPGVPQ